MSFICLPVELMKYHKVGMKFMFIVTLIVGPNLKGLCVLRPFYGSLSKYKVPLEKTN